MKLISMTDFVLDKQRFKEDSDTAIFKITNYANFLKQPLKLEMFVPCDEDGNFFEEPRQVSPDGIKWEEYLKKYEQAKNKVLFEGFRVFDNNKNVEISNGRINLFFSIRNWVGILEVDKTIRINAIEDLTKYYLTLTPDAIKQLAL